MFVTRPPARNETARMIWDWLESRGFFVEEIEYNATIRGWYCLARKETEYGVSIYAKTFTADEVYRLKRGRGIDAFET